MYFGRYLIENSIINKNFNTPKELFNWMNKNIKYKEYSKLMSAEEVFEKKCGSCHDQVNFEKYIFQQMHIKYGLLFLIEYNKEDSVGGSTHSLLYYKENNKYYWFENSWGGHKGIFEFDSLKDLKDNVKELMLKNSKYKYVQFSSIKNIKTGMTLNEYVNACLS